MVMSMPKIAMTVGVLLIVLGVGTYGAAAAGLTGGEVSKTALIPAGFGILLLLCGIVVQAKPNLRKHVMHVAALIGVLGVVGALMRPLRALSAGTFALSLPVAAQLLMAALCAIFVVLCVKSFIEARKARDAASARAA